jgi:hypothetical protein
MNQAGNDRVVVFAEGVVLPRPAIAHIHHSP